MRRTFPQGGYSKDFESVSVDGGGLYDPFFFEREDATHAAMGVRRVFNEVDANMKKIVLGGRAYLILSRYSYSIYCIIWFIYLVHLRMAPAPTSFVYHPFSPVTLLRHPPTHTHAPPARTHILSTSSVLHHPSALLLFSITLLRCCWLFSHHPSNAGSSTLLVYSATLLL